MPFARVLAACLALSMATTARGAETPPDTLHTAVPGVEVRALRARDRLADVPGATFVVSQDELRRAGVARLATVLQWVPGLYGYRQRASGDVEVVDPRGFTASGESSYLKVLVDGQDVRDLENGNVDWDWVPPDEVDRVEIVQGPGAWVYGDASEGGIVNVVRRDAARSRFASDCALRAGSFGLRTGSMVLSGPQPRGTFELRGQGREVDGWRDHSRERVYGGGGDLRLPLLGRELRIDAAYLDADRQDPGTLTADQLAANREQSENPNDFQHDKRGRAGLTLQSGPEPDPAWSIRSYLRGEDGEQLRTLFFQPLSHHTIGWTGGGELTWRAPFTLGGRGGALLAGAEAEQARLRSDYYGLAVAEPAPHRAGSESWRTTLAATAGARLEVLPHTVARLSLRGDLTRVRAEAAFGAPDSPRRSLTALTPLVSLNRELGRQASAYVSTSTAFRVPTLYQMFDRRPIFVGPPAGDITLSNSRLDPQRSWSVEIGGRWDGSGGRAASIAGYSTRVRDEIDFDLATLSYANINRSWHRGIEASAGWPLSRGFTARASGAWTPTTFDGGDSDGKQINGVPEATGYASLGWSMFPALSLDVGARVVGRQFLDKLEQHPLGGFVTWDAGVAGHVERVRATLRVLNLGARRYSDTGFIGAFGEERFSPAAPRSVVVSLSLD